MHEEQFQPQSAQRPPSVMTLGSAAPSVVTLHPPENRCKKAIYSWRNMDRAWRPINTVNRIHQNQYHLKDQLVSLQIISIAIPIFVVYWLSVSSVLTPHPDVDGLRTEGREQRTVPNRL
jgi:hypothetical protein